MRDVRQRLRSLLLPAGLLILATALGLGEASQVQYDRALQGDPISWGHALIHGLPRWYAWALLAPLVVAFTRRARRADTGWLPLVALHLLVGGVVTALQVALNAVASQVLHRGPDPFAHLQPAFLKYVGLTFFSGLLTYAVIVGSSYAWDLYRGYRAREAETARLEARTSELKALLAESQLQRLRSQLEPHFLFNALNAISALMLEDDTPRAIRMTSRLSSLLRRALRASERSLHTVSEEVDLLRDYLSLQSLRYQDRLEVRIDVDPGAARARVPALLLQPLVENAVRHGIEVDPGASRVEVRVVREGDALRLLVANDGPPLGREAGVAKNGEGSGVGLPNTRRRLAALYGERASLELRDAAGGGVEALVTLPYTETAGEEAAGEEEEAG